MGFSTCQVKNGIFEKNAMCPECARGLPWKGVFLQGEWASSGTWVSVAFQAFPFLPAGAEYQNAVGLILVGYVDKQNLLVKVFLLL